MSVSSERVVREIDAEATAKHQRRLKRLTNFSIAVALTSVMFFVGIIIGVATSSEEPEDVLEISTLVVVTETGEVPEVPGVLPPAIAVDFGTCANPFTGEPGSCTVVPLSFDRTNLTDQTLDVEAQGTWRSVNLDDNLNVVDGSETVCVLPRSQNFPLIPGTSPSQLNSAASECVLEHVRQQAAEGVYLTVWQIEANLTPNEGKPVTGMSQNFTLVHPDFEPEVQR